MKKSIVLSSVCTLALGWVSSGVAASEMELPQITEDGLHKVEGSKLAVVYAEPGADLSGYDKVQLMDAYVAFKKNWERDQKRNSASRIRMTSKDIEEIKNRTAGEFAKVFTEELEAGGYPVVDTAGEDVLLLRPAIINLDITAPDTRDTGRSRSYADSAGEMTLYLELYDSVTGDLIAKAIDRKVDRQTGMYTWTNSSTNRAAADRIMKGWAEILLDALNEARNGN